MYVGQKFCLLLLHVAVTYTKRPTSCRCNDHAAHLLITLYHFSHTTQALQSHLDSLSLP